MASRDEYATRNGVRNLRAKYEKKERLKAKVELTKLDYDAQRHRVQPHLTIDPGPKVTVKAVEAKVSKRLLKRYVPVFQERAVDNDLLVEGKRNLSDYFQGQGYYDVSVEFRVLPPAKGFAGDRVRDFAGRALQAGAAGN